MNVGYFEYYDAISENGMTIKAIESITAGISTV